MAASPAAQLRKLSILGPSVLDEKPQFNKILAFKPKDPERVQPASCLWVGGDAGKRLSQSPLIPQFHVARAISGRNSLRGRGFYQLVARSHQ
jgi:hypothetical protein